MLCQNDDISVIVEERFERGSQWCNQTRSGTLRRKTKKNWYCMGMFRYELHTTLLVSSRQDTTTGQV